jgi:hypothetical protein
MEFCPGGKKNQNELLTCATAIMAFRLQYISERSQIKKTASNDSIYMTF